MRKTILISSIIILLSSFISDKWELVNSADDISVYNRKVKGYGMPQSKVETFLEGGSFTKVKEVLRDIKSFKNWFPKCTESTLIESKNGKFIYYTIYDAPWPVSDRDGYIEVSYSESENEFLMFVKALPKYRPDEEGMVRIPLSDGKWTITKKKKGVSIVNISLSRAGGNIPDWLTTTAVEDTPLEMIQNLVSILNQ